MKRAIIVGCTGQIGSFLAEHLLKEGYQVHGLIRKTSSFGTARIEHIREQLELHYYDLAEPLPIVQLLNAVEPDEVYNLAAQSHVQVSFQMPVATGLHTGLSTATMLEAIRIANPKIKFYQASSSEMFGNAPPPQHELTPIQPRSPYAAAKAYAYWMTKIYREAYGMFAVNGILFNAESERRNPTFVTRKITQSVARIAFGLQKKLVLGNLDARRDWGFAGEYAELIHRMMQHEHPSDWVVATGKSHTVREFLGTALAVLEENRSLEDYIEQHVEIAERYQRPLEVHHLCGDATLLRKYFGWEPQYDLRHIVRRMLAHDMKEQRVWRA